MKLIGVLSALIALGATFSINEECPHDVEVKCIDDINKAYPIC